MAYIKFENIVKAFDTNQVLKGIDLGIEKGELITLLGPSGCGKSTLLRCLAGLEEVSGGHVYLDGDEITHVSPRKRQMGMVFQQYSLFPNMNVEQNVGFGLKMQKMPKDQIKKEVREALRMVGLGDRLDAYPVQLSGGMQQRVALARAIVMKPKVLLLDEPLSAIDAKLRKSLQIEIRRIQKALNITTIFVTHDQDEAMIMSDRICLLNNGQIEQAGTPVEIYTNPHTNFAASFIGNYNILRGGDFTKVTGVASKKGHMIAIRPETIGISKNKMDAEHCFEFEGTIVDSRSRGNVLRYQVEVNGVELHVDTLFRSFFLFESGEKVWLNVESRNCLSIDECDVTSQLSSGMEYANINKKEISEKTRKMQQEKLRTSDFAHGVSE